MSAILRLTKLREFPECISDFTELADLITTRIGGTVEGALSYIISDTKPAVGDQDKAWFRTVLGKFEGIYVYESGAWIRKHETPASGSERRIWVGDLAALQTYDGGSVATVSDRTGPFWEEDASLRAKFPVGVGTTAGGTVIPVTGTGGEDKHQLTAAELPEHSHTFQVNQYSNHDSSTSNPEQLLLANLSVESAGAATPDVTVGGGGSGDAHNNLPPFYGVYFIKRTARIYRTAS